MVSIQEINDYADRIAREFNPNQIILFGSYAYGNPTSDSDVDLLVVMPIKGKPYEVAAAILTQTRPPFPIDLLVRTPEELNRRLRGRDYFLREVVERGKVLHGS